MMVFMASFPAVSADINFVILRVEGRIPVLARCARCDKKFFTPRNLFDPDLALEYLSRRFTGHRCANPYQMKQAG